MARITAFASVGPGDLRESIKSLRSYVIPGTASGAYITAIKNGALP